MKIIVCGDVVKKSRFSFSSKQAKDLGDSMIKHYIELAENPVYSSNKGERNMSDGYGIS